MGGEGRGAQHRRTAGAVRARGGRETGKSPAFSPRNEDEAGREGKRKRGRGTEAPWMRPQRRKASQSRRGEKARTSSTWGTPRRCRHFSERTKHPTRKARAGKRGGGKGEEKKKPPRTWEKQEAAAYLWLPELEPHPSRPANSQGSCSRPGPASLGPAGLPREKPAPPASSAGRKGPSKRGGQISPQPFPVPRCGSGRRCCSEAGEEEQPVWERRVLCG